MVEVKIREYIKNLERNRKYNIDLMEKIMKQDLTTTEKVEMVEAIHRENREIGIKLELLYHLSIDSKLK